MLKTVKFGGSSLADAQHFKKAADIIRADAGRRYVVVSAPGKRFAQDIKITDLLYRCCEAARQGYDFSESFDLICSRYREIIRDLEIDLSLEDEFAAIEAQIKARPSRNYAASRGEYLSARVMAAYLGMPMIDAAECIFFDGKGEFDSERTQHVLSARLKDVPRAVLPGFYGSNPDGRIRTFSRGGSDVTGAIVARASASDIYENWTDVSGMLSCDPRIVENPEPIETISYAELRELAYMGAMVLHESAIFPVKKAGIPINIRNTNDPAHPGTMILPHAEQCIDHPITGIAGHRYFTSILIGKDQMNETVGFAYKVLYVLAKHGILLEHMPSGIDTLSVIVSKDQLAPCLDEVVNEIRELTHAESIAVKDDLALIAVVGRGMVQRQGICQRVFSALGRANVNVYMIDSGSGELNIIIGVSGDEFEIAISALYEEFFGGK